MGCRASRRSTRLKIIGPRLGKVLLCGCWLAVSQVNAQRAIVWNSDPDQTNLTSTGAEFDGQFKFELGVFADSFVPTKDNTALWASLWRTASPECRTTYVLSSRRYAATFTPTDNAPPFAVDTPAYVWGFRGDAVSAEWILFRAASWKWPIAILTPSPAIEWYAKDATAVLGTIHSSGSPFLMQSVAMTNERPSWMLWQEDHLAGEARNGPQDDPDGDGVPNMLEYVFGTSPRQAGAATVMPVAVVGGHVEITIPRRIDHPAALTVEVSSDLTHWQSGAGATTEVPNTSAAWVVRDETELGPAHPRRFIRLKAELVVP